MGAGLLRCRVIRRDRTVADGMLLVLVAGFVCGCAALHLSEADAAGKWPLFDDMYDEAIRNAEVLRGPYLGEEGDAKDDLRQCRVWKSVKPPSPYHEIREKVKRSSHDIRSSIRFETGNAAWGIYSCEWLVETSSEVRLYWFIGLRPGVVVEESVVDKSSYKELLKDLREMQAWEVKSNANYIGEDFPGIYISLLADGREHQIVTLGHVDKRMLENERMLWAKPLYEKTRGIIQVIELVSSFCRPYTFGEGRR